MITLAPLLVTLVGVTLFGAFLLHVCLMGRLTRGVSTRGRAPRPKWMRLYLSVQDTGRPRTAPVPSVPRDHG